MSQNTRPSYLTDHWTNDDHLYFSDFRPALESIMQEAETPLTVGIFGAWAVAKPA